MSVFDMEAGAAIGGILGWLLLVYLIIFKQGKDQDK